MAENVSRRVKLLQNELARVEDGIRFRRALKNTLFTLTFCAAAAIVLSVFLFPVVRIYGDSMSPSVCEGDIVAAFSTGSASRGDVVVFYYGNKVLVKRCIAVSGDLVDIDGSGNVFVNGERLVEPYVETLSFGECDIELPMRVPEGRIFVIGDSRAVSVDSRSSQLGCIASEQIVGKLFLRVWPITRIGIL